jgi:adenylate cyclase
VNIASRVSERAYPGSVLATEDVKEHVEGEYRWSFAGEKRLKGIKDEIRLYRVRPDDGDGEERR